MSRTHAPRLLLVEPNKGALGVMARRLGEHGYRVIACESATAAMAELHRVRVDVVLSELRLPVQSGVELVRMIRDDIVLKETPVILITGRSDASGAVEGFGAGADDVVAKPFDFEVLVARIERRLARARSIRELHDDNANLDARIVTRAIEIGEMKAALLQSEMERQRLERLVGRN